MGTSLVLLLGLAAAAIQDDIRILHDPVACWPTDQFLAVRSTFEPPAGILTAKLYFRSGAHPDYYYVELTLSPAGGRAIAPKAAPETREVVYYLELVTTSFSAFRTEERRAPVDSGTECRRRDPGAAYYTGSNPDISVGSTRSGVPRLPPGFQADGISQFIDASGIGGEVGGSGGINGTTLGIIAGAGGAGAAALALGGGSDSATTTSPPTGGVTTVPTTVASTSTVSGGISSTTTSTGGGPSTSVPPGSTTTSAGGGPSTTTVPAGSTTSIGTSTTTSVSTSSTTTGPTSSTTTSAGSTSSTTTSAGPSTTTRPSSTTTSSSSSTTSTPASTSSSTTSSVPSSTTTTAQSSTADLRVTKSGPATVTVGQEFVYTITVDNLGPGTARDILLNDSWTAGLATWLQLPPMCGPTGLNAIGCNLGDLTSAAPPILITIRLRATAPGSLTNDVSVDFPSPPRDPNPNNDSARVTTRIVSAITAPTDGVDLTYRSRIALGSPGASRVKGQILLNGGFQETDASSEFVYGAKARNGVNRLETELALSDGAVGFWTFDFAGSRDFVPGSIRVEAGRVASQTGNSVTFALGGGAPAPRFTFRVGEPTRTPPP